MQTIFSCWGKRNQRILGLDDCQCGKVVQDLSFAAKCHLSG